jgi:serine/threonine protein phosphatase PrpC
MKEAREGWTKLCESLRKYELLVEQTRREAGELIPKVDMQAWIEIFYFWFTMSLREQAQSLATALSGATETVICETIGGTLADACFNTALVYLAKGGDSRMVETTRQFIAKNQRLTEQEIDAYIAELAESIARNVDTLAPREFMVSKAVVDRHAAIASRRISELLDKFVNQTACRLPGVSVQQGINLLLDHIRPTIAEIQHEIGLFRVAIGGASPELTLRAVNDQCAKYWRNWQRACGVRAEGFEKGGK